MGMIMKIGLNAYILSLSNMNLCEIEDGAIFKLEPNVNLLFIVIIDVGFARKCLSTLNC